MGLPMPLRPTGWRETPCSWHDCPLSLNHAPDFQSQKGVDISFLILWVALLRHLQFAANAALYIWNVDTDTER